MIDLWYKNAVIYCIDVETFRDGNGDGIGDFRGLSDNLDHVEALGATCIWLLPFYPSPNRDNGYDIADYYGVDPRHGTLGDFVEFMHAARDRGLRVIVDLVVNHTSRDHPWFQASRSDAASPFRDWYVWRKEKPADAEEGIVFPGVQKTTWTYDRKRGEYYFHRFYDHQPDLNIANPAVREEIQRIMGFWLALGVSGFRIDAVPFMLEDLAKLPGGDPYAFLSQMQTFLSWRKAEAMMLAEANIPLEQADDYFGEGDRLHVVFNFPLNQKLFLALARGEAAPVAEVLAALPELPAVGQWATFLRNHDEIDLGRLEPAEKAEVFAAFGPEPGMQIFERGIRRRLAPMLGGDERRIAVAFSVMLALPGTPVIWYGDEIGMGEDLSLDERGPVRMPMPWRADRYGGFSEADPKRWVRPPLVEGPFAHPFVNAERARREPGSLFNSVQRLIRLRRACREIGWGRCDVLPVEAPGVLALRSTWAGGEILTLHNLADSPATVDVTPLMKDRTLRSLLREEAECRRDDEGRCRLRLAAYGYDWLRLEA